MKKTDFNLSFKIIYLLQILLTAALSSCREADKELIAEQWKTLEITLSAENDYQNGYTDNDVWATFINGKKDTITRPAFWDGGRI